VKPWLHPGRIEASFGPSQTPRLLKKKFQGNFLMSTVSMYGPFTGPPKYALAASLILTKATEQTIMLGTPPDHVLSTSILYSFLLHDRRFQQVPMSEAAPGDIVIASHKTQADGYAGIVVDHGRIVSNGSQGVQNNSSLVGIQPYHPEMAVFRYIGFRNYYRSKPLANVGYSPDEPRIPAGQSGGGRWTKMEMAASTAVQSGGNTWTGPATGAPPKP
jgi:hypothetical protein